MLRSQGSGQASVHAALCWVARSSTSIECLLYSSNGTALVSACFSQTLLSVLSSMQRQQQKQQPVKPLSGMGVVERHGMALWGSTAVSQVLLLLARYPLVLLVCAHRLPYSTPCTGNYGMGVWPSVWDYY